jgi:hypothetical protein
MRADRAPQALDSLVQFYEGSLLDEPTSSHASGAVIAGAFYGTVRTADGHKYFFEAARKFNHTLGVHSIVYRESDVNLNRTRLGKFKRAIDLAKKRQREEGEEKEEVDEAATAGLGCASAKKEVKEWMQREQEELYNERIKSEVSGRLFFLFYTTSFSKLIKVRPEHKTHRHSNFKFFSIPSCSASSKTWGKSNFYGSFTVHPEKKSIFRFFQFFLV